MRSEIRRLLSGKLNAATPPTCKMCGAGSRLFDTVDYSKNCERYPLGPSMAAVTYFRCVQCELIFTNFFDDWSAQDFSQLLYNEDYVLVDPAYTGLRGVQTASNFLVALKDAGPETTILDFGAGNGSFADTVRHEGFDRVIAYDPYVHEEQPVGPFDIVTSFEVLEHSTTPRDTLDTLLSYMAPGGCVVVCTGMQPLDIEKIKGDWWYIGPRNGHATFYSYETIRRYAAERGLDYRMIGDGFILSDPNPSDRTKRFLRHHRPNPALLEVGAPQEGIADASWGGIEQFQGRSFRWTIQTEAYLGIIEIQPDGALISLPVPMRMSEEFMHDSFLRVGGQLVKLWPRNNTLCAIVRSADPIRQHISLVTPAPVRPCDLLGSEDTRSLGIAVSIVR